MKPRRKCQAAFSSDLTLHPQPSPVIYLDHHATTPVLVEVREAMLPNLSEEWGHPSSSDRFGSKLKPKLERGKALWNARELTLSAGRHMNLLLDSISFTP